MKWGIQEKWPSWIFSKRKKYSHRRLFWGLHSSSFLHNCQTCTACRLLAVEGKLDNKGINLWNSRANIMTWTPTCIVSKSCGWLNSLRFSTHCSGLCSLFKNHLALCIKELLEKSIRHCWVLGQRRQHFVSRVVLTKTRIQNITYKKNIFIEKTSCFSMLSKEMKPVPLHRSCWSTPPPQLLAMSASSSSSPPKCPFSCGWSWC